MAWLPISGIVPQATESGNQANGMVLKFYEPGTLTPLAMATDSTGTPTTVEFILNTQGYTTLSTVEVIPHSNQIYKAVLYLDQTDADANDTGSAVWEVDNVNVGNFSALLFNTYDNLADAIAASSEDVGNFLATCEYTAGSLVGGGKYQKVSVDPGANELNPATSDGNWLLFINDSSLISTDNVGLSSASAASDVVETLNSVYPYIEVKGWGLSVTEILPANAGISVTVPTTSTVRGEGGFLFSSPASLELNALRMVSAGSQLVNLSITVSGGEWNRCITHESSNTLISKCDIDFNTTASGAAFVIFSVSGSGIVNNGVIEWCDITGTSTDRINGINAANFNKLSVLNNTIHDLNGPNNTNLQWCIYFAADCQWGEIGYNKLHDCNTGGIHNNPNDVNLDVTDVGRVVHDNTGENLLFISMSVDGCYGLSSSNNTWRGCDSGPRFIKGSKNCSSFNDKVFNTLNAASSDVNKPAWAMVDTVDCNITQLTIADNAIGNTKLNITMTGCTGDEINIVNGLDAQGEAILNLDSSCSNITVDGVRWVHPAGQAFSNSAVNISGADCTIRNSRLNGINQVAGGNIGIRNTGDNSLFENNTVIGFTTQNFNTSSADAAIYHDNRFLSAGVTVQNDAGTNTDNKGNAGLSDSLTTETTTNLNLLASEVNTRLKIEGKEVFDTALNRPVYAAGSAASSVWVFSDGTTANTPA